MHFYRVFRVMRPSQATVQFHHRDPSYCPFIATVTSLPYTILPQTLATTNLFTISIILLFQKCYTNRTIQNVTFWNILFLLNIIPMKSIQVVTFYQLFVSFYCWVVFHGYRYTTQFHPLKDRWIVFSFRPLVIKLLWIFIYRFLGKHKYSFLWDKCPKRAIAGLCGKHIQFF